MIEPGHPGLSVSRQCALLSISRSSFYYTPKGESEMNLALMREIDEQFLDTPFFGVRQMTWHLKNEGHCVNEKRIAPPDAAHGPDADLPEAQHLKASEGAQDLAVSTPGAECEQTEPGLGNGYHLPADAPGVPVPGCHHGLVYPHGAGLAHLEHAGG